VPSLEGAVAQPERKVANNQQLIISNKIFFLFNLSSFILYQVVEVGGIAPPSLSNQIKVASCLVYLLRLIPMAPVNKIHRDASFCSLVPLLKANTDETSLLPAPYQTVGPSEREAHLRLVR